MYLVWKSLHGPAYIKQKINRSQQLGFGTRCYFDSKPHIFVWLTNAAGGYWYTEVQKRTNPLLFFFIPPKKQFGCFIIYKKNLPKKTWVQDCL